MIDLSVTTRNLEQHVRVLTQDIGERSVAKLWNHAKAADYIEKYYSENGISVAREPYTYKKNTVANIVAEVNYSDTGGGKYIVGAHYDSVAGTVGADDNASGVAVQLEVARELAQLNRLGKLSVGVRFVSFALEEPPAFGTPFMGSRVHVATMKKNRSQIDGMICLEMVGYSCHQPGCQKYPFPLMYFGYPDTGNYIGIVGNWKSRHFTTSLRKGFEQNRNLPVISLNVPWSGYFIPNVRLSDHAPFWDKGYIAVMITDTAFYRNPHYHQRADTMRTLDFQFMSELVKSLVIFFSTR